MAQLAPVRPQQTFSERIARIDVSILTPIGKAVLLTLAGFGGRYTGTSVWASLARIVAEVGFSHGAVLAAVKRLHAIGALVYDESCPRPPGIDKRVRGRAIVIDHLTATPRRSVHQVDASGGRDPSTRPAEIRPPGGLGSVHQVDSTSQPSSSPSETRKNLPGNTPPNPPSGVGVDSKGSTPRPDAAQDRLTWALDRLGVASGPRANRRWLVQARTNPHARTDDDLVRVIIAAVRAGRARNGEDFGNYASDFRHWMGAWRPRAAEAVA